MAGKGNTYGKAPSVAPQGIGDNFGGFALLAWGAVLHLLRRIAGHEDRIIGYMPHFWILQQSCNQAVNFFRVAQAHVLSFTPVKKFNNTRSLVFGGGFVLSHYLRG